MVSVCTLRFHGATRRERERGVRGRGFDPRHCQKFLLFCFTVFSSGEDCRRLPGYGITEKDLFIGQSAFLPAIGANQWAGSLGRQDDTVLRAAE